MKKLISILMIVAMLFILVVAAIPAGAAATSATTLDPNKVGNVVITESNREAYQEELLDQGYIPLVNYVWPEYADLGAKTFDSRGKANTRRADGKTASSAKSSSFRNGKPPRFHDSKPSGKKR